MPTERYLDRSHLSANLLKQRNDDSVISALSMLAFAERAALDTGISDLGYWAGALPIKGYGNFGVRVVHSPTLYCAVQKVCSGVRDECSEADYYLISDETNAWFCHGPIGSGALQQQHELYALMIMVQVIRLALGEDWKPARLRIQQKWETTLADNDWLLGSNIEFGASAKGI